MSFLLRPGAYARAVVSGRTSSGGRGRWLIVVLVLGLAGAAAGAWAGRQVMPEEPAVAVSLAVAGFGLGGVVAMLGLALRALLMRAARRVRRSRDAAATPALPAQDLPPEASASPPTPAADTEPEPAAHEPEPTAVPGPAPHREPVPEPPAGGEAGWYPDPQQPGARRYWDGRTWTAHVWRDRDSGSRRGSRQSR